jgi:hypothetical protein
VSGYALPHQGDKRHVCKHGGPAGIAGHLQKDVWVIRGLAHHQTKRFLQSTIILFAKSELPTEMLDLTSTYPVIKKMCLQLLLNTVYALLIMGLSVAPTLSPDEAPHILLSSFIS